MDVSSFCFHCLAHTAVWAHSHCLLLPVVCFCFIFCLFVWNVFLTKNLANIADFKLISEYSGYTYAIINLIVYWMFVYLVCLLCCIFLFTFLQWWTNLVNTKCETPLGNLFKTSNHPQYCFSEKSYLYCSILICSKWLMNAGTACWCQFHMIVCVCMHLHCDCKHVGRA